MHERMCMYITRIDLFWLPVMPLCLPGSLEQLVPKLCTQPGVSGGGQCFGINGGFLFGGAETPRLPKLCYSCAIASHVNGDVAPASGVLELLGLHVWLMLSHVSSDLTLTPQSWILFFEVYM